MRRHAKAPSAGSTQAIGESRGLLGRVFAIRGVSAGTSGSGAPAGASRSAVALALTAALVLLVVAPGASAAEKRVHLGAFGEFTNPASVAVDQTGGDVYVVDLGDPFGSPAIAPTIKKFDSAGNPVAFSALKEQNSIDGSDVGSDADQTPSNGFSLDSDSQVAVDSSGGLTDGNIYLADSNNGVVDVFAPSGTYLDRLTGSTTPQANPPLAESPTDWAGINAHPCGVAVAPSGSLYVSTAFGGQIERYVPAGAVPSDSNYDAQIDGLGFGGSCGLSVDSTGAVYSATWQAFGAGALTKYLASDFGAVVPAGAVITPVATSSAVDQTAADVFVDEGAQISQFDSTGAAVGDAFGPPNLVKSSGIAVHSASDRVYASEHHEVLPSTQPPSFKSAVHIFGPVVTVPDVSTGTPSAVTETGATLAGSVDPDGVALTDCQFEYLPDADFQANVVDDPGNGHPAVDGFTGAATAPCDPAAASIPTGPGVVPVTADIASLNPGTVYRFRLRAANANADVFGDDVAFVTAAKPIVQTLYAGPLGTETATLAGRINPRNQPGTTYQFEWGTDDCSTHTCTPLPAVASALGSSDDVFHTVTAPVSGLSPDTTYHFRLLATNPSGTTEGPDHGFRTFAPPPVQPNCPNAGIRASQGSTHLPDCMAYELVSPDKQGAVNVVPTGKRALSPSGDRAVFMTLSAAPGAPSGRPSTFLAERSSSGWSSRIIDPVSGATLPVVPSFFGFSDDLSRSLILAYSALAPGAKEDSPQLYSHDNGSGAYQLLTPLATPGTFADPTPAGATPDFGRVLYDDDRPQANGPVAGGNRNTYLWDHGQVKLAGVLPDGSAPPDGSLPGSSSGFGSVQNSFSRDGVRAVFHAIEPGVGNSSTSGQLYVRTDDGVDPPFTRHITASKRTVPDPSGPLPAVFWNAEVAHGNRVLFTSCEKLTDDSTASTEIGSFADACTAGNSAGLPMLAGRDLYLYDFDANDGAGGLLDLTTTDPSGARVFGVVAASEDLSRIYFTAGGDLDPGSGAVPNKPNLYLWEGGETHFIVTLNGEVNAGTQDTLALDKNSYAIRPGDKIQEVRTNPAGDRLLITTFMQLTGYDNANPSACPPYRERGGKLTGGNPEGRCTEAYLYDANSDRLSCVSCSNDGALPLSPVSLYALNGGQGPSPDPLPTGIASDGSVFFETADPLLNGDSNGMVDVYRWHAGTLNLISSGTAGVQSHIADVTPSGDEVMLYTRQRLLPSDHDSQVDLYAARTDGGFSEPIPNPACEGDACLTPPVVPNDPTPSSSNYAGPGNQAAAKKKHRKRNKHHAKRHKKKKAHNTRRAGK